MYEVVAQQHLQEAHEPRFSQHQAVFVIRLIDELGDEATLLKGLHLHLDKNGLVVFIVLALGLSPNHRLARFDKWFGDEAALLNRLHLK